MSQVFNVRRSDGWDRSSNSELFSALIDLPIGHTATVTIQDRPNSDLSSVVSVFRVPDGWVVHSPAEVEPVWVSLLRASLSAGKLIDKIDF